VCVCARARVCACVCVSVTMCARVGARVGARARACACVCVLSINLSNEATCAPVAPQNTKLDMARQDLPNLNQSSESFVCKIQKQVKPGLSGLPIRVL
jgi:hypothetical protein